jgi:hypothetical protein
MVIHGFWEWVRASAGHSRTQRFTAWAILGLAVLAEQAACGQPPNVDVNPLVPAVAKAVAADEALAGAWLHVDAEDNGAGGRRPVFRRILDADRAAAQIAGMDRIVKSLELPAGGWRIDKARDVQVPYTRLSDALNAIIAKDPRFEGCRFLGGFYMENDADRSLGWAPRFEVVREQAGEAEGRTDLRNPDLQYDALVKEVRTLFATDPAWKQAGLSVVDNNLGNRQMVVVDRPAAPELNQLVRDVAAAIQAEPSLGGAWLKVKRDDQGAPNVAPLIYVFQRVLDEDRVGLQSQALEALIRRFVPAGRYRVDASGDVQVPHSRLTSALNALVAKDPRFEGCRFLGGFYRENDADGSLGWAPRFEVVSEQAGEAEGRTDLRSPDRQFDALVKEARALFAADPAWQRAELGVIDNNLENRQLVVVDRPAAPELNKMVRDITSAIQADPALEGSWLNVTRDDQGAPNVAPLIYVFQRVLDEDRIGPQSQALEALIRRFVPADRYRVDASRDVLLPYSRMTAAVRDAIRRTPKFEGCEFLGGFYAESPADDSLGWAPRFAVVEEFDPANKDRKGLRNPERQFDALVAECRKLLAAEPRWKRQGISVIDNLPKERGQQQVRREPAGPTKEEVMGRIAEAIRNEAALRGAWLDVQLDDQGAPEVAPTIYAFNRGFDASRVGPQAAALDSLMARLVPSGRRRIDSTKDVTLPLTGLIQDVNEQADLDPAYAGCLVSAAFYERSPDDLSWQLVPEGRLWRANQAQPLHDLVRENMAAEPAWAVNAVGMSAKASGELELVAPNPGYAAHHFSEAMKRFWSGDYRGASDELRLASLDWPDNLVYRYWRVLAELADGDQSAGETRLARTIAGFGLQRHSRAHLEVLRSIYRVQGPLRYALMRAEDKAMVGLTTGGGVVPPWGLN